MKFCDERRLLREEGRRGVVGRDRERERGEREGWGCWVRERERERGVDERGICWVDIAVVMVGVGGLLEVVEDGVVVLCLHGGVGRDAMRCDAIAIR